MVFERSLDGSLEVWITFVPLLQKTIRNNNKNQFNMKTFTFSYNKKLNGVLNEILSDLLSISETEEMSRAEVARYFVEFKSEPDYNLAQYGNLLIYYYDVREFYRKHGYKSMERWSDTKVWETYLRQVGYVARLMMTKKAFNR